MTKNRTQTQSVTGRDGYLMMQALAYTIEVIERLPKCCQEYSNKEGMKAILATITSESMAKMLRNGAKHHLDLAQASFTDPAALDKEDREALFARVRANGDDQAKA